MFIVLYAEQWHVGWFLSHSQTPYHSSILPTIFVNGVPRALIFKTKSNQSQGPHLALLEVLHSYFISRYWWEGRCLRFETSGFKPRHVLCQLGLGLDSVHDVKAVFLEQFFQAKLKCVGRGGISNGDKLLPCSPPSHTKYGYLQIASELSLNNGR